MTIPTTPDTIDTIDTAVVRDAADSASGLPAQHLTDVLATLFADRYPPGTPAKTIASEFIHGLMATLDEFEALHPDHAARYHPDRPDTADTPPDEDTDLGTPAHQFLHALMHYRAESQARRRSQPDTDPQ